MTDREVMQQALEAGFHNAEANVHEERLERFAALVAAAEREACAKVCEEDRWITGFGAADAIRARGEK